MCPKRLLRHAPAAAKCLQLSSLGMPASRAWAAAGDRFTLFQHLVPTLPAVPRSWRLYSTRSARDLSYLFLALYNAGLVLTFVYL